MRECDNSKISNYLTDRPTDLTNDLLMCEIGK